MKLTISLIGISFFMLVVFSASGLVSGSPIDLTIVYSNNINGQIRPCPG